MDANGTRYHLVQGWPDWRRFTVNAVGGRAVTQQCEPDGEDTDVVWDCASSSVTLRPEVFRFLTAPGDRPPSLDDRRGAGVDSYANWYWIAGNGREIIVQSSGSGTSTHYWSAEDELERQHEPRYGDFGPAEEPAPVTPLALAGLAVTQDAYLVVGVTAGEGAPGAGASTGLLVFDLLTGGPPSGRRLPPNGATYAPDSLPSPPDWISFPPEFEFTPFDMAPRPGGGVFVLDREHRRVWLFDRTMNLEAADQALRALEDGADDFAPVNGSPVRRSAVPIPSGISVDAAVVLGLSDPVAIEALADDAFFVLNRDPAATDSRIYHFVKGRATGDALRTGTMRRHVAPGAGAAELGARLLVGHDIAFAPVKPGSTAPSSDGLQLRGKLAVASAEGNQVFEFEVYERVEGAALGGDAGGIGTLTYDPLPLFLPMRLFGGKAIVAVGDKVYYNFDGAAGDPTGERWLPLVNQNRSRFIVQATLFSPGPALSAGAEPQWALDGKEPDCVWHRLFVDVCIPPGTSVRVQSRAANDPQALDLTPWQDEPGFYRRPEGSELPYTPVEAGYDTHELLFQAAKGQYLQLALTLQGSGQATPRLRSLRAYYGRFSYLAHYMPAIYRDQVALFGASGGGSGGANGPADHAALTFLDRFLALFEGFFTSIEDKIAAAQALLDPRSAPPEALDWLASWFGVAFDPQWDEVRRRLFIRYALTFFSQRGTLNGLLMALQLGFGQCTTDALFTRPLTEQETKSTIRIVEQFRTRQTPAVVLGDPTESEGLRLVTVDPNARWRPEQGASQLQDRYATYLQDHDLTGVLPSRFRPVRPASDAAGSAWEAFCEQELGFVPAFDNRPAAVQLQLWQDFLARRYGSIEALNSRYGLTGASTASGRFAAFAGVSLPDELPQDGAGLFDWYAFFSVVPAMHRAAHHFVVLLPAPAGAAGGGDIAQAVASQTDLVRRIVELEKPAHTTFAVRFYWAMFRLGEARLGVDSLIDYGGRSPQFMQPLVLGQTYLAESFLTATFHDETMYARRRSIP